MERVLLFYVSSFYFPIFCCCCCCRLQFVEYIFYLPDFLLLLLSHACYFYLIFLWGEHFFALSNWKKKNKQNKKHQWRDSENKNTKYVYILSIHIRIVWIEWQLPISNSLKQKRDRNVRLPKNIVRWAKPHV